MGSSCSRSNGQDDPRGQDDDGTLRHPSHVLVTATDTVETVTTAGVQDEGAPLVELVPSISDAASSRLMLQTRSTCERSQAAAPPAQLPVPRENDVVDAASSGGAQSSRRSSSLLSPHARRTPLLAVPGQLAVNTSSFSLDSGKVSTTDRQAAEAEFNGSHNPLSGRRASNSTDDWGTDDRRRIMMANFYGITAAEMRASHNRMTPDLGGLFDGADRQLPAEDYAI